MSENIEWDLEFDDTPLNITSAINDQNQAAIEFARKRSGGLGASEVHRILTNRPDYSKIPELEYAIAELQDKIENSKTGKTVTAEKDMATKQRQLDAILNDQLPQGAKDLAKRIALQRFTGFCEESDVQPFETPAMRWGKKYESEATERVRELFPELVIEEQQNFKLSGYSHHAATPDLTLWTSGYLAVVADIKCPFERANHYDNLTLLSDNDWQAFFDLHNDYAWQAVSQMSCANVNQYWFISYDPRFPKHQQLVIRKFELRQADKDFLLSRVSMFETEVNRVLEKLAL